MALSIRELDPSDIPIIVSAFQESGWQEKPISIFEKYLDEQNDGRRTCFVAFSIMQFQSFLK